MRNIRHSALSSGLLILMALCYYNCDEPKNNATGMSFVGLDANYSGIRFSNNIAENDSLNYANFPYIYMGGGVAIGDINNDGLSDIYFTGNMVGNRLYLNKGNLQFEDISYAAGITGDNRWYTGVNFIDINSDGWLDIYVCVSGKQNTSNQLFINNGDLTFRECSKEYNLNDSSPSIQSVFFDYDNDGFLDLFVGNYPVIPLSLPNVYYFNKMEQNGMQNSGHLYRNTGKGSFRDVTEESGLRNFGLTLGLSVSDFNNDGWKDIYVSNDFQVPDFFYLNNGNGTFTNTLGTSFGHTSMFGMGIDASDFNNDGFIDLVQMDMTPADYVRSKTNMASMDPASFWEIVDLGGHYQYMQNSLQLNNGIDLQGIPTFSEISRLSGVATTDWSWGTLIADFDNDAHKDIFITNGIRRDVNYNDLTKVAESPFAPALIDIQKYPSEPLHNYLFQGQGNFKFKDVSIPAGFGAEGFSNGVAYADLDNDGDLDLVINNLDGIAQIYRNETANGNNFLKIQLLGPSHNLFGVGARVEVTTGNNSFQMQELSVTRGFQSTVDYNLLFGLGQEKRIKMVKVLWPNGHVQKYADIQPNQTLKVVYNRDADTVISKEKHPEKKYSFRDVTKGSGIRFDHIEDPFNDFVDQPLLPHKYSSLGPALAVADVNNDGRDDFFIGNARNSKGSLYVQTQDSKFILEPGPWEEDFLYEDTGALFFDPDNDGDQDLLVTSGGNYSPSQGSDIYLTRMYVNINGEFKKCGQCLPAIKSSGQAMAHADYDLDGDMDLFIGGRIVPGHYPLPAPSYLLKNEGGKDMKIRFVDVTEEIAPDFSRLGLVSSAVWKDFNRNGIPDLVLAGEWMPVSFYEYTNGKLMDRTSSYGLDKTRGWWYSLKELDMDGDGDLDLVAGNLGLNYKYRTAKEEPFQVYYNDFDENGDSDIVLGYKKKDRLLPLRGKECSSQQVPAINLRFKTYESFAKATLPEIYGEKMLRESLKYEADTFEHCWFENVGAKGFEIHPLPRRAQFSSINAIEVLDINNDNRPDLLIGGNLLQAEVETPRNDSSYGLVLLNHPDKTFETIDSKKTGLFVSGEIRNIQKITIGEKKSGTDCFLIARNNDSLKLMEQTDHGQNHLIDLDSRQGLYSGLK